MEFSRIFQSAKDLKTSTGEGREGVSYGRYNRNVKRAPRDRNSARHGTNLVSQGLLKGYAVALTSTHAHYAYINRRIITGHLCCSRGMNEVC